MTATQQPPNQHLLRMLLMARLQGTQGLRSGDHYLSSNDLNRVGQYAGGGIPVPAPTQITQQLAGFGNTPFGTSFGN